MKRFTPHPEWTIIAVCVIHFYWSLQLFFGSRPKIAAWYLLEWMPQWSLALLFLGCVCSSLYGIARRRSYFLLPLQFVLMVSAGGVIALTILGQYADHARYGPAFIFNDQLPLIVISGSHSAAVWYVMGVKFAKKSIVKSYERMRDLTPRQDVRGGSTWH